MSGSVAPGPGNALDLRRCAEVDGERRLSASLSSGRDAQTGSPASRMRCAGAESAPENAT